MVSADFSYSSFDHHGIVRTVQIPIEKRETLTLKQRDKIHKDLETSCNIMKLVIKRSENPKNDDLSPSQKKLWNIARKHYRSLRNSGLKRKEIGRRMQDEINSITALDKLLPSHGEFIKPERRFPPVGEAERGNFVDGEYVSCYGNVQFLEDESILKVHPMKYVTIDSADRIFKDKDESLAKIDIEELKQISEEMAQGLVKLIERLKEGRAHFCGVSEDGKHVILQQATRSCVPTAASMLILDHKGIPPINSIFTTDLAYDEQLIAWLEQAGFKTTSKQFISSLSKAELSELLKKNGPGVLTLDDPKIGGHTVVLDEISLAKKTATLRDPFHGWRVTISLKTFDTLKPHRLTQIKS